MKRFERIEEFLQCRREWGTDSVGFVPTMGALHDGHCALVQRAVSENDRCVVSIFINPTQFDRADDLHNYPVQLSDDLARLQALGVDAVLLPDVAQMYPDEYRYKLSENDLSTRACGAARPGHFDGVLTVVMKLLNIARPTRAYFGEKDQQQLQLIQGMVEAFFMDLEIVPCATVREASGLAMSSRNLRLSADERTQAAALHRILSDASDLKGKAAALQQAGFKLDYLEPLGDRLLAAVWLGDVRLIDNVAWPA